MKSIVYTLLLVGGSVLAQDISSPAAGYATSTTTPTTTFGTIDQPTATRPDYNPSQPTPPSQSSAILPVSAPQQPTAPLSPGLPTSPTAPLSALVPQQPSQPAQSSSPTEPQQPTPSANPPTPVVVGSADSTAPSLQSSAHTLAARTLESLQNMSNSLNNLVRIKSN